jgi:hypothetical protein
MFYVFSHFPCNDGELSRMIWQYYRPNSIFYNWKHHETNEAINKINKLEPRSDVVFLDVTPPLDILPNHHTYTIIDHHKDAIVKMLNHPKYSEYRIKMIIEDGFPENNKQSGCILTWNYLSKGKDAIPSVVRYIGMKDVWDFSDVNTEPYNIAYNLELKKYQTQDERINFIMDLFEQDRDEEFINIGTNMIINYKNRAMSVFENVAYDVEIIDDTEYTIVDVQCSENELFKYLIDYAEINMDMDILRIHHSTTDGKKNYSLRRLKPHIKVDIMARKYGGNGHEGAAGYSY